MGIPLFFSRVFRVGILTVFLAAASGCIRLAGGAGYFTQKKGERTERAIGFDSAELFQKGRTPGSVTV